MQFDREKLKAVILYACSRCDPTQLGAVKLHKVLYFADMLHYAHVGASITGATYRKRPFGPTCDSLLPMLRDLERNGDVTVREVDYFGYRKKEFVPNAAPELNRLSDSEVSLLDEVIEFVCGHTAKTISDFSHQRPWEMAEYGGVLKYNSSFHMFPTEVSTETLEWGAREAEKVETARSHGDALGDQPFGTLRSRVLEILGTR